MSTYFSISSLKKQIDIENSKLTFVLYLDNDSENYISGANFQNDLLICSTFLSLFWDFFSVSALLLTLTFNVEISLKYAANYFLRIAHIWRHDFTNTNRYGDSIRTIFSYAVSYGRSKFRQAF